MGSAVETMRKLKLRACVCKDQQLLTGRELNEIEDRLEAAEGLIRSQSYGLAWVTLGRVCFLVETAEQRLAVSEFTIIHPWTFNPTELEGQA